MFENKYLAVKALRKDNRASTTAALVHFTAERIGIYRNIILPPLREIVKNLSNFMHFAFVDDSVSFVRRFPLTDSFAPINEETHKTYLSKFYIPGQSFVSVTDVGLYWTHIPDNSSVDYETILVPFEELGLKSSNNVGMS